MAVLLFASKPAASQNEAPAAKPSDTAPTPRTADGHVDLSGMWTDSPLGDLTASYGNTFERSPDGSILYDAQFNGGKGIRTDPECVDESCQLPNQPPYKPEYMEKVKQIAATENGGSTSLDPEMQCKPYGIPRGGVGGAMQIVQTPKTIAILYEGHPQPSSIYRVIYMDSPHPADLDTTYMGDSRGHWVGDTLVVDVTGLNDETWLGGNIAGTQKYTSIHSDKEHVVERWSRKGDVITYEATVDDPVMFSRPWVVTPRKIYVDKVPGDQLLELFCTPEATGGGHFVKPSADEQKVVCGQLGKADYDACVAAGAKKAKDASK